MELRQFAEQVLLSTDLSLKLLRPGEPLTDNAPGPAVRVQVPGRPAELQFAERRSAPQCLVEIPFWTRRGVPWPTTSWPTMNCRLWK